MIGQTYKDMISASMYIALQAHSGQRYGDNDYFFYHVMGVAEQVMTMMGISITDVENMELKHAKIYIAAILHDVVEDSSVTLNDLHEAGIDRDIITAVDLLTKAEGQDNDEYVLKLRENNIARRVKMADSLFNLTNSIMSGRKKGIKKYTKNLQVLNWCD